MSADLLREAAAKIREGASAERIELDSRVAHAVAVWLNQEADMCESFGDDYSPEPTKSATRVARAYLGRDA